jgi:hypothetical protein
VATLLVGSDKDAWRKHIEDITNDLVTELSAIKAKMVE